MIVNNYLDKTVVTSLLNELSMLNSHIGENRHMFDLFRHNGLFLFGFNLSPKIDPEAFKWYVSISITISHVLDEFDIKRKYNGYSFITDSIMLIIDLRRLDIVLGDDIYPHIRKKYKLSNKSLVEHNIRNAINTSYKRYKEGISASRMSMFSKKPTNKEFLFTVTHEVCNRMCMELLNSDI